MRLPDICTIQTGYTVRSRLDPVASGGVPAIQLRDISPSGSIAPDSLARVALDGLADRFFVRAGDIVFRSRGDRNTATALDDRFREPAVAVLPLIVLRPKLGVAMPEYIAWAMNQPEAQRHFDATARGTSLRMVPKSALEDLELNVPALATQRLIVQLDALADQEQSLMLLLAERRRTFINRMLAARAMPKHHGELPKRITR